MAYLEKSSSYSLPVLPVYTFSSLEPLRVAVVPSSIFLPR